MIGIYKYCCLNHKSITEGADYMSAIIFENINPRDKKELREEKLLNVLKNSPRFDGWTVFWNNLT